MVWRTWRRATHSHTFGPHLLHALSAQERLKREEERGHREIRGKLREDERRRRFEDEYMEKARMWV